MPVVLLLIAVACGGGSGDTDTTTLTTTSTIAAATTTTTPATTTTEARPVIPRIRIRTTNGSAEFYDESTGEPFIPMGVNYVDFHRSEGGWYEDRVLATDVYDRERVDAAFERLAGRGYTTARIFFDTCGSGQVCVANPTGAGLNEKYLDNLTDLMWIAQDRRIRLILTANSLPSGGGYWETFDRIFAEGHEGFDSAPNADWLHRAGVEAKKDFWRDLMSGLAERGAPFEVVLGWELTNEFWLHGDHAPISLDDGTAVTANGSAYDLSDPDEKVRMVADGVVFFIDEIRAIIAEYDPEGLVTMGFFAPAVAGDRFVDTASILERADLDFWDLHAYYDTPLTVAEQVASFGIEGYRDKPIVMGETGSGKAVVPSAVAGLTKGLAWIEESCLAGFDGWLNWGYYPWPDDMEGAPWTLLDDDGRLLRGLSPDRIGDPCDPEPARVVNAAWGASVRASRSLSEQPPGNVVDGATPAWNSGSTAPQWLEIGLAGPTTVLSVGMVTEQWPPGPTHHQVWLELEDGRQALAADIRRYTTVDMRLGADLEIPVPGVVAVRVETIASPAWVAWREVDVVPAAADDGGQACLAEVITSTSMRGEPLDDAEAIYRIAAGKWIVAEARMGHWLRVPGDLWITETAVAMGTECDDLPEVDGPRLDLVPVTFTVTVPEGTSGEVFIGGYFPETGYPPWIAHTILLPPGPGRTRSVTVELPSGTTIEYVYSLGGFEMIERPPGCGATSPREVRILGEVVIEDEVVAWQGAGC